VIIVPITSDLHFNCTVALSTPVVERDRAGTYHHSPTQAWLWASWLDYWDRVEKLKRKHRAKVVSVFNGDLVDMNTHSHYELISLNEDDVISGAIQTMEPGLDISDYHFVVRGTEAHTGGCSWVEEQLAKWTGAEPDEDTGTFSWYWLTMKLNGLGLGFAHQPCTNTIRRWTQGNAANRQAATLVHEFFGEEDHPDLAFFGHFHHNEDSYDNYPIRVIYLKSWVAHTSYDERTRSWELPKIGGVILMIDDDGDYDIEKITYKPKRRAPWRMTGKPSSSRKSLMERLGLK